nr:alpha/beta hydrolase [Bradyrhizobium sp. 200]
MSTFTTRDGTSILYKDWGPRDAQPIMFHHGWRQALLRNRAQFFLEIPAGPFYRFNRDGAEISEGLMWRHVMMGDAKAHYDCITAFSETDFTKDLQSVSLPVPLMHGEDDQVVPVDASARKAIALLPNGILKRYPGLSHGMFAPHPLIINADLLAFIQSQAPAWAKSSTILPSIALSYPSMRAG